MEISVVGKAESFFPPDLVVFSIDFFTKAATYEKALSQGSTHVLKFINAILLPHDLKKEDLKTNNFTIKEETEYDKKTKNIFLSVFRIGNMRL